MDLTDPSDSLYRVIILTAKGCKETLLKDENSLDDPSNSLYRVLILTVKACMKTLLKSPPGVVCQVHTLTAKVYIASRTKIILADPCGLDVGYLLTAHVDRTCDVTASHSVQ